MAIGKPILRDLTTPFNSVYQIYSDMSGWDRCTIQVVGPLSGRINIMGTNDSGAQQQNTYGNAMLAINYTPILAKDLSTGSMVNAIYGAGLFEVDINAQFLKLQGSPASAGTNVYRILLFNQKNL